MRCILAAGLSLALLSSGADCAARARFPDYVRSIPPAFRGRWDELQQDKCRSREPRYTLGARQLSEFEVNWDVAKVKRYSPAEIDIFTTAKDEDGRRVTEVWGFRLVENGAALSARKSGGVIFRKCPVLKGDD